MGYVWHRPGGLVWWTRCGLRGTLSRLSSRFCEANEITRSIAGHVSRAMLSRYSHVRMEAKRGALDEVAARKCADDENRQKEAEGRAQALILTQLEAIQ